MSIHPYIHPSIHSTDRQSASQPASQPASQSVSQSVSHAVTQSVSQSVSQSLSQSASQSVCLSVCLSVCQSVSQSITQVHPLRTYSDHCPISLRLTVSPHSQVINNNTPRQAQKKTESPRNNFTKFFWKTESKDRFVNRLSSPEVQEQIDSFNSKQHTLVDEEISQFNQIINSVAKSCLAPSRKSKKSTKKNKPWYDQVCRQLKKQLQQVVKKINPTSPPSLRQEYFVLKKKYKRHVKMMHIKRK